MMNHLRVTSAVKPAAFFGGLVEQVFQAEVGIPDTELAGYVTNLLIRFIHMDEVHNMRALNGRRLTYVTDMWMEAKACIGEARRVRFRHIGDYTLFWVGIYPEALLRLQALDGPDCMLEFPAVGKMSYSHASVVPGQADQTENDVLARLSHEFDRCVHGLQIVRQTWEGLPDPPMLL